MSVPNPAAVDWVPMWSLGPQAAYVPSCLAYRTTNQTGIAVNTQTSIVFDAKLWDTDNIWSAGAPSRLTCRTAGKYVVCAGVWLSGQVASGSFRLLNFVKNGVVVYDNNGSLPSARLSGTMIVDLQVGDYMEVAIWQDSPGVMQADVVAGPRSPWISMAYLGPNASLGAVIPPTYGTSLPASPVDGQEAVLVDSLTAPTYQWRFRYNAGSSSAYKWEFIGGTPITVGSGTTLDNLTADGTWQYGATPILVDVPRAGDYDFACGANVYGSVATSALGFGPGIGAANTQPVAPNIAACYAIPAGSSAQMNLVGTALGLAAGSAGRIILWANATGGGTGGFRWKRLMVTPRRVL